MVTIVATRSLESFHQKWYVFLCIVQGFILLGKVNIFHWVSYKWQCTVHTLLQ